MEKPEKKRVNDFRVKRYYEIGRDQCFGKGIWQQNLKKIICFIETQKKQK